MRLHIMARICRPWILVSLGLLVAACGTPTPEAAPFRSDRFNLGVSLPTGWQAAEGPTWLARPFLGLVAFNSWGEAEFWAPEVTTEQGSTYSPQSILGQLPDGGAYVALIHFAGGPLVSWEDYGPEYGRDDLGTLWQAHDCRDASGATWVDFSKWGRRLRLEVYCEAGATDATAAEVNEMLASWRFDRVPAGDAGWATLQARQLLPDSAHPEKFPLLTNEPVEGEPMQSYATGPVVTYLTSAEIQEDRVVVTFLLDWNDRDAGEISAECSSERCHWWRFEARPNGEVVLVDEGGAALPFGEPLGTPVPAAVATPGSPTASPAPPTASPALPTATPAPPDALTLAQEALAAHQPFTDARPVVGTLSASIAAWLRGGGDPAALAPALTTTSDLGEAPAAVTEVDLTGDGQEDVVVRVPVMGLPLLVFVRDGLGPPGFAGHALPPDLSSIQTDFPMEVTEFEHPAVQLQDLDGDGIVDVVFTTEFVGGSNYRLRPKAYRWQDGDFRLVFAADLVSWDGESDYALKPDPAAPGRLQFVLTYPHLYDHGFDHKMVDHPLGRQVWRWNSEAGRYVLFEKEVDLEHNAGGLPAAASDQLRWLTNEGEEAFRAGQYEEAIARYEAVLRRAEAEDWQPGEEEADWRAYAAFRRAEALLLLARPDEGLSALEAVATDMEGDLLGELARAFLQGYGSGEDPDAAARGVAAMQGADLYAHFYYERGGALRFPMEASGILYLGAGMVAYLNAHPDLAGDLPALRAGLAEIGFQVGGVLADENGDLSIIVPLPNRSYAYGQDSWVLAVDGDRWHVSLPVSEGEWPVVGWFAP